MDALKLNLTTKFMKGIITKLISKAIFKKYGYKIDLVLNEISVEVVNGKAYVHADVDAEVNNDELMKIVKSIGLD
jgi:hypothetical protein